MPKYRVMLRRYTVEEAVIEVEGASHAAVNDDYHLASNLGREVDALGGWRTRKSQTRIVGELRQLPDPKDT